MTDREATSQEAWEESCTDLLKALKELPSTANSRWMESALAAIHGQGDLIKDLDISFIGDGSVSSFCWAIWGITELAESRSLDPKLIRQLQHVGQVAMQLEHTNEQEKS